MREIIIKFIILTIVFSVFLSGCVQEDNVTDEADNGIHATITNLPNS